MKIFIIDNETARQRNLRSILGSMGYKSADVESADDPSLGMTTLKKKHFNVIFVSMVLPKTTGLDVLREIRENSRLKSLPVLIYSSEVSKENVMQAVQAGASGFLGYPFSVNDVESAMQHAIKAARN